MINFCFIVKITNVFLIIIFHNFLTLYFIFTIFYILLFELLFSILKDKIEVKNVFIINNNIFIIFIKSFVYIIIILSIKKRF